MAPKHKSYDELLEENEKLRLRLDEAEETLRAIQGGEIDALVISGPEGNKIYTLEGAEQNYRILVESMHEGAATLARDGTVMYSNRFLASMLKIPLEKLIGSRLISHINPVHLQTFETLIGKIQEEGNSRGELELITEEGNTLPVIVSCGGLGQELSVVLTDLSEQKRNEKAMLWKAEEQLRSMKELREKERLLIQQSRLAAMGEMIGFIAHQWRQPLNTVGLIVQEVAIHYKLGLLTSEHLEANTEKVMQVIKHMSKTIDDFRNFFRDEKQKARFKISDILGNTIELLDPYLLIQQVLVEISSDNDISLEGYPNEYAQVLLNIIMNACDVCLSRNVSKPKITIRIFNEDNKSVVTIADNAGGIPEDILEKIFDPYFTTKGVGKGTGIGLFMGKTIIEKNMGGRLTVRNTDIGAEFRIEI